MDSQVKKGVGGEVRQEQNRLVCAPNSLWYQEIRVHLFLIFSSDFSPTRNSGQHIWFPPYDNPVRYAKQGQSDWPKSNTVESC